MLLASACQLLGWPDARFILHPPGEGAAVCANLVNQKIGDPLRRFAPQVQVSTGILIPEPETAATLSPMAIICEFPHGAPPAVLDEAHRLAWNFSRSALLVTLEPHKLVAWSCFQDPSQSMTERIVGTLEDSTSRIDQTKISELLHWVSLITGKFQRDLPAKFSSDGRADQLLLKNLRHVRNELIDKRGLDRAQCHDLLARVIFTQFLFHRKDSGGNPYFSKSLLKERCEGSLEYEHADLASILQNKRETYALFRWLDGRFNGDLFPGGENQTDAERASAWALEESAVKPEHLRVLAELVSGRIDTSDRQLLLWPLYSFDTIPLEFISSVYEEFLNEDRYQKKAYYTPSHLVDYVLDAVLPWAGTDWDLKILDPSCGSGIFLVKAFQRIVHRWKTALGREPFVNDLKPLLANNFMGVDYDPDAVRVACFSLYLAMADAIDPKHYVTQEKVFPRLRGSRLITQDFFDESAIGLRTIIDANTFDLVIGNAPWGDGSSKQTSGVAPVEELETQRGKKKKARSETKAERWAKNNRWTISNHDIGPLFIAKGLELVKDSGRVAMLQPAPPWLYQRGNPALELRRKLFSSFTVDEITNLSAVRRELFPDVIGPACIIVVGHGKPKPDAEILYFVPKPRRISAGLTELSIEPHDIARITHDEAANDPLVWTVLSLGGQRDLRLIRRLQEYATLEKLKKEGKLLTRMGVIPGDKKKPLPDLRDKPYFEATHFPADVFLWLDAANVPEWRDPRVDSLHGIANYEEFKNPQLLIKHSYSAKSGRFRAALVKSDDPEWGVICKETYLSVRDLSPDRRYIHAACLAYNSLLTTYYLFLTSSRFGHYITEVPTNELVTVPLPDTCLDISDVRTFDEIDSHIREQFALTDADWVLIDDMLDVSLPDALRKSVGRGRRPTVRNANDGLVEPELSQYGHTFCRVLQSTFGQDKPVAVTIFCETDKRHLPVRVVTLHLGWSGRPLMTVEPITPNDLRKQLSTFHRDILNQKMQAATGGGVGFQRVGYFFHTSTKAGVRVQNLTIIKPDEYRYWTRSQAMRDADDLGAAILTAATLRSENRQ